MNRISLFLILLGFATFSFAQKTEIDSLNLLIYQKQTNPDRLITLNRLTFLTRERNIQKALEYGLEAEKLALDLQDSLQLGRARGNLGWMYYRLGVWDKAFKNSKDAYLIGSKMGDKLETGNALNNLGALYYQRKNYPEAINNFKEALQIGWELGDSFLTIRSLNNIALNFSRVGELDSAFWYANKALETNEKTGSIYFTSFSHRVIGDVLFAQGKLDSAILVYENALVAASHQRLKTFESSIMHRLGNAYLEKGDMKKSFNYLEQGLIIAEENGFKDELINTYKILSLYYDKENNVEKAYHYHKAYSELNDAKEEIEEKDKMALLQAMFEVEKTEAENELLRIENELKNMEVWSAKRIAWIISVSTLLLIVLSLYLIILNKKLKKAHTDLIAQNKALDEQKQVLVTKSEELAASNRTKNRILSILGHDLKSPVAQLVGILDLLHSNDLSKEEFDSISHILKRNVDGLFENMDNILTWSKSQMEGFVVSLQAINLVRTIRPSLELLDYQARVKNINIQMNIDNSIMVMVDSDLLQVIIRNLVSNAIKFSINNSKIDILSEVLNDGQIELIVQDYGLGMSEVQLDTILNQEVTFLDSSVGTNREKGTGLGLSICKEFAQLMGGSFSIKSKKGEGTRAIISLQLANVNKSQETA